jgi:hypothetical protein
MRSTLLTGSLLLALTTLGCATASPQEVCRQMVDQECERNFECRTDKDTAVFQYVYGANVEECKARYYASNGCDERTQDSQNCVRYNVGKENFDASRFEECQEALGKLACQDYVHQQNDSKQVPAVCRQMCD